MKKTFISLSLATLFSAGPAQAMGPVIVNTTGNNFTMVSASNGLTGGTNDVTLTWDGTYRTAVVTDSTFNATLSSPTAFSGKKWTAHHVNVYGPGTYVFDTTCPSGGVGGTTYNPSCGTGTPAQRYTLTVGNNQVGAHMLFNWSTSSDIDVMILWDMNKSWAETGTTSSFCGGAGANCSAGGNTSATKWTAVSIDTPASAIASGATADESNDHSGTKMIDGPFVGQSPNFNVNGIVAKGKTTSIVAVPIAPATLVGPLATLSADAAAVIATAKGKAAPTGVSFDDGFVKYQLTSLVGGAGGTASVTISFPSSIDGKDIYHFKESTGVYTKLAAGTGVNQYQVVPGTNDITLKVDDGGMLDDDGPANGTITDPIGAGTPPTEVTVATLGSAGGGGGGCALNPNGKFDASMILTLLASLGYLGWKRKRHN